MIDLRTPSVDYNHGGYYGPADPRNCSMPNGPCNVCAELLEAANLLVEFKNSETCPMCEEKGSYRPHPADLKCSSCDAKVCVKCMYGSRYFCPLVRKRRVVKSS